LPGVGEEPITIEAVEKVIVGPVGSPKQIPNRLKTLKTGFKAPEWESEKGTKEFFNTLTPSRHLGE
jgi:hypothetical protein